MIDWDSLVLAPAMGVFGDAAVIRPRAGAPFTVADAVYADAYTFVVRDRDGNEVTTTSPMLGVRTAACPALPKQHDTVEVGVIDGRPINKRLVVKDVRDDGHGHLVLLLNEKGP